MNKIILIGHVGSDPDVKSFEWGSVAEFSIATSESWKDKRTGEKKSRTDWHKVKVMGARADVVGQYVKKGDRLAVEGKMRHDVRENQDGSKSYFSHVQLDQFEFLNSKSEGQQQAAKPAAPKAPVADPFEDTGGDLPF